ncbi:Ubiquitin fusion degradation protein 1 [Wickerhamomyces ciferrii]|uniref:Ubiquitin fusion degradation protein 1 n=1 Tax=Wickerhamomyces ciferrii (strain ATCC 14091 / BCRC 22168 / CBS 111 / JCM 3599 / NBRC 0793 / NRRL Y-1031 F-60-10) TaxID=1206466 RepID=K0KSE1_WICCF|nr:Ubiquitin fusion degradation protein 1 [Wickerhamomyces ciferrii]CCH46086.1 Ubiquitin fusion degradation protein 1 [Wickerhamomyces ciferrii]
MMPDSTRKDDANFGGKIFLPPSALNRLTMLHIRYPMLFELKNEDQGLKTHSGVLEFVAEEGRVYLPQWMMSTLQLKPGAIIKITNSDVPLGKFVKIEPQSVDFLDISDPKAVLENVLRKFSTLSVNDIIEINYNDKIYGIKVLEAKPESDSNSICVIETDLETDFAPPVGYVEPDYSKNTTSKSKESAKPSAGKPLGTMAKSINYKELAQKASQEISSFKGDGVKLSGKASKPKSAEKKLEELDLNFDGPPARLELPDGQLFFGFPLVPVPNDENSQEEQKPSAFVGQGQSLRQSKKRKDTKSHESPKPKVQSPEVIEID